MAAPTLPWKGVQIVPLGPVTVLERSGTPKNHGKEYKYCVKTFCLAKVMPKTRFWPHFGAHRGGCTCMHVHICTSFFGPINRTPFGPNGYFAGTFWPKPSLLGSLRSLKKNVSKYFTTTKFFFEFWIFGGFWGLWQGLGPSRPPNWPKKAQHRPKTCFGHNFG